MSKNIGGQWQVVDPSGENSQVTINGYLPGVSPSDGGTDPNELLLSANLKTGANKFGYTAGSNPVLNCP